MSADDVLRLVRRNPVNAALPQCHLVAGCVFQAVWNARSGRAVDWGVRDHDVFYFDAADVSWAAEDAVIRQAERAFADLPARIEVRNQARVHLWYRQRFGGGYPQLSSAREGIDRYLVACTCMGVDAATGALYTPNGLDELVQGVLRLNPLTPQPELFAAKADSYRTRWPWLRLAA
ncbi:hypothetical protein CCO03_11930 [Comamonas serinivorans]|uniref:Nucleotidyltransferase family protein n=2 Tax=Comamonas serinivorans TaxID=1082851 RepID=A0A1Y0ENY3_9BURK|nr:hypothetical protein CCO03_11930 [Comamonas serinivorans]